MDHPHLRPDCQHSCQCPVEVCDLLLQKPREIPFWSGSKLRISCDPGPLTSMEQRRAELHQTIRRGKGSANALTDHYRHWWGPWKRDRSHTSQNASLSLCSCTTTPYTALLDKLPHTSSLAGTLGSPWMWCWASLLNSPVHRPTGKGSTTRSSPLLNRRQLKNWRLLDNTSREAIACAPRAVHCSLEKGFCFGNKERGVKERSPILHVI